MTSRSLALLLLAPVVVAGQFPGQRRCFVCSHGDQVEALTEAPAHLHRCTEIFVVVPESCQDLLTVERLEAEKSVRLETSAELERRAATAEERAEMRAMKLDVAKLWNALRVVRRRDIDRMWGDLTDEMSRSTQELVNHGLVEEAGQMF